MKLVTFRDGSATAAGVVDGDMVIDLRALGDPPLADLPGVVHAGTAALERITALARQGGGHWRRPFDGLELLAPLPRPTKNIFCIGRNYLGHVEEGYRARGEAVNVPQAPQIFTKPPTAVIGTAADLHFDPAVSDRMDYEGELGLIIGKAGRDIAREDALDHVFGFTVINDITARDLQRRHEQWFKGKALDVSCPMGPWIVTRDEIDDITAMRITTTLNGEVRQSATVSQMIFDIPTIIAELSRGMTLEAGDIIATGTPEGVGYAMDPPQFLADGDVVTVTIDGVGEIINRIALG